MKIIITENQFRKLIDINEDPDFVYDGNYGYSFNDDDSIPFGVYQNNLFIGYNKKLVEKNRYVKIPKLHPTHYSIPLFNFHLNKKYNIEDNDIPVKVERDNFMFLGRIWFDRKIISLWDTPATKKEFINLLNMLKHKLYKIYNISIDFDKYKIDIPDNDYDKLVSLNKFIKSYYREFKVPQKIHLLPPELKSKTSQMKGVKQSNIDYLKKHFGKTPKVKYDFYKYAGTDE